jgi:hypothetical protein
MIISNSRNRCHESENVIVYSHSLEPHDAKVLKATDRPLEIHAAEV